MKDHQLRKQENFLCKKINKELRNKLKNAKLDRRFYDTEDYNIYLYFANYERTFYRVCYYAKKFLAKSFFCIIVSDGTKRVFVFGVRVYKFKNRRLTSD
jgi:hypothetical protein